MPVSNQEVEIGCMLQNELQLVAILCINKCMRGTSISEPAQQGMMYEGRTIVRVHCHYYAKCINSCLYS